jgi:hypothetical protein
MNSCRFREHICPVRVSQSIAVAHSACVGSNEAVEMLDQRLHDLPQARIGNLSPALKHHIGTSFSSGCSIRFHLLKGWLT